MGRPLRIEYPGAIYHVTSRGDRQEPIFRGPDDRQLLLDIVDHAMSRMDAEMFAFCLMGNHYHFVLRTRQANLSGLMRHVNGEYTRAFNRRHRLVGHVFQGRFHAVLVDRDAYLVEVCRYVELNPVRAGLVSEVVDWPWCSYAAHVGFERAPRWLATASLHGFLLGRDVSSPADQRQAEDLYAQTVAAGRGADLWRHLRREIFLGDESFAAETRAAASERPAHAPQVALADWLTPDRSRDEAFRAAHVQGGMTMTEIARQARVSVAAVGRIVAAAETMQGTSPDKLRSRPRSTPASC
jgi:REP element-mobilizing transposase RayT